MNIKMVINIPDTGQRYKNVFFYIFSYTQLFYCNKDVTTIHTIR